MKRVLWLALSLLIVIMAPVSCGEDTETTTVTTTPALTTTAAPTTSPTTTGPATTSPTATTPVTTLPTTTPAPTTTQTTPPVETTTPAVTPPEEVEVSIENYAYVPDSITVPAGTTVTWTNMDAIQHTVTHRDDMFDSGLLSRNESFSYTFNEPGEYEYYCIPHPFMVGTVIVE